MAPIWVSEGVVGNRAAPAQEPAGRQAGGRSPRDLGHLARGQGRLPLVRLPC
jgi:hypothetical protein